MSAPELKPCPFCKGGETRIDPQGQTWLGQKYSDPICWRLIHFCKGILSDDYVTNRMELRARTQEQCIEAWNTRAHVAVKPLVWEEVSDRCWDADGMGKLYRVMQRNDGAVLRVTQWEVGVPYESIEAAKEAAQADYERRIRGALA